MGLSLITRRILDNVKLVVMSKVSTFDEASTRLIAKLPPSSRGFFKLMSRVGHPITICCIAGIIIIIGFLNSTPTITLGGAFIWIAMLVSTILKNLTKRSRPLTDYVAGMRIRSFSFPSGHTTGSTITFGLLAYYALHFLPTPLSSITIAILTLTIISVGVSRVYLGAHFPTDVIGGWLLGATILTVVMMIARPL